MAEQKEKVQDIAEIDYMLRKYYHEHIAPVVSAEIKVFKQRQDSNRDARSIYGGPYAAGTGYGVRELMQSLKERISKDQAIGKDLGVFSRSFEKLCLSTMDGKDYKALSGGTDEKNLSEAYIRNRLAQLMEEQVARSRIPKTSMEYIIRKGCGDFFLFEFSDKMKAERAMDDKSFAMYNPSAGEKVAAGAVTFMADSVPFVTLHPLGGVAAGSRLGGFLARAGGLFGKGGGTAIKASVQPAHKVVFGFNTAAREAATKEASREARKATAKAVGKRAAYFAAGTGLAVAGGMFSSCSNADEKDAVISQQLTGKDDGLKELRNTKFSVSSSEGVHDLNDQLSKKVKLQEYRLPYSPSQQKLFKQQLAREHGDDFSLCQENASALLTEAGYRLSDQREVPQWMMDKTPEELMRLSDHFTAEALELSRCGKKEQVISGKTFTAGEVAQRGYDYARAALLQQQRQQQEQQSLVSTVEEIDDPERESSQQTRLQQQMSQSQDQWGGAMESLGLTGAGEMAGNLGYTLGMLPDMIYSMLTGKNDKLRIENNIFPLMAIFGGMFLKNPILKWLMIGLGATNLLNKGYGVFSGRDANQAQQKTYKRYPDEPLSPRVRFHGVKDDRFIVDIDGKATTFAISEDTMAAYRSGVLPENTLLNAAVRQFDVAEHELRRQYDLKAQQEQDRQVVRLGVG